MKNELRFGVVGHGIGYSQSPDIFDAVSRITGRRCRCTLHDIAPDRFDEYFPQVLKSGIDGFSVTIPYKRDTIPYMTDVDPVATAVGAVNSVAVRDGKACGFNTDSYGFSVALKGHIDDLGGGTAMVFGAGGAARAVIHCLHDVCRMGRIIVLGRNESRLTEFQRLTKELMPDADIEVLAVENCDSIRGTGYDIVVNATPLGGWNHPDESPFPGDFRWPAGKIYYDLNYNADNKLVARAAENSMIAFDGSQMLVAQALLSVRHWSGLEVDFEPVYGAVFGR